jgi:hypothetical protein
MPTTAQDVSDEAHETMLLDLGDDLLVSLCSSEYECAAASRACRSLHSCLADLLRTRYDAAFSALCDRLNPALPHDELRSGLRGSTLIRSTKFTDLDARVLAGLIWPAPDGSVLAQGTLLEATNVTPGPRALRELVLTGFSASKFSNTINSLNRHVNEPLASIGDSGVRASASDHAPANLAHAVRRSLASRCGSKCALALALPCLLAGAPCLLHVWQVAALARAFRHGGGPSLRLLDLRGNEIGDAGAAAVC